MSYSPLGLNTSPKPTLARPPPTVPMNVEAMFSKIMEVVTKSVSEFYFLLCVQLC